jgi:ferredoxin
MVSRNWPKKDLISPSDYSKVLKLLGGASINLDFIDFNLSGLSNKLKLFSNSQLHINRWGGVKKIGPSSLSLDILSCINCGLCLDGCLYNCLFDTRRKFIHLINTNQINYIPDLTLESFKVNPMNVTIYCKNDSNNEESFFVKNLVIGAGAISSSIIAMKSLNVDSIEISDSQSITFPLIRFKNSKSQHYQNIELSDLFVHSFNRFGRMISHTQIYPVSRITKDFFKRFLISEKLSSILSVGHTFLDPDKSGKIILDRVNLEPQSEFKFWTLRTFKQKFQGILSVLEISYILLKNGILLIPFFKFSRVGHSYHFGTARCKSNNTENYINDFISKSSRSVLFVDGSAIPHMPPGPPTLSLITYAYKLTQNMLTSNLKNV